MKRSADLATAKTFSTSPKTRRHVRHSISGDRCRDFMQYLWQNGFRKECKYEGLRIQFIQCFETNDARVVEKYIGRPKLIIEYSREQVLRRKQSSQGVSIARFEYAHKRESKPKTGLMEMLGYMILDAKTGHVTLCHESQPYYTVQTELVSPPIPPLPKSNECYCSIDNLRVCSIGHHSQKVEAEESEKPAHVENSGEGFSGSRERREREEYRPHTHKSVLAKVITKGVL